MRCRVCSWGLTRAWTPWRSPRALALCHACRPVLATPILVLRTAPPPEHRWMTRPSARHCTSQVLTIHWQISGFMRRAVHGKQLSIWNAGHRGAADWRGVPALRERQNGQELPAQQVLIGVAAAKLYMMFECDSLWLAWLAKRCVGPNWNFAPQVGSARNK